MCGVGVRMVLVLCRVPSKALLNLNNAACNTTYLNAMVCSSFYISLRVFKSICLLIQ